MGRVESAHGYPVAAAVVFALLMIGAVIVVLDFDRGDAAIFAAILAFGLLGAVILWRRPGNAIGWVFSAMGLSGMIAGASPETGVGELIGGFGWFTFFFLGIGLLPMLYPTGKPVSPRWRWVVLGVIIAYAAFAFLWIFQEEVCDQWRGDSEVCVAWAPNPIGIEGIQNPEGSVAGAVLFIAFISAGVAGVASLVVRYRRAEGIERQQVKWLLLGLAGLVGAIVVIEVVMFGLFDIEIPELIYDVITGAFWLSLPVAAGLAIFRYGLYDIDRIISRTVAYGIVAVALTLVYIAVVLGIGALAGMVSPAESDLPLPILATALVAIAFQPVRQRALAIANRLVFGRRRTPYEALSGLAGGSLEELIPQIAHLATESTAARGAVVWLSNGSELTPAAVFPEDGPIPDPMPLGDGDVPEIAGHGEPFPLTHHDDLLGAITVVMPSGEDLSLEDQRLLRDLAAHAAVTLHAALEATPLPTGIVTFLMTDIEGSTRLWEEDPEAMAVALRDHDSMVRRVVGERGGVLIKWKGEGDSTFSVFTNAAEAVGAAIVLQQAMRDHAWATARPISVRAGLHTGEAQLRERDYFGQAVNRCARLRAVARGGQTLVSAATRELARENLDESLTFRDLGELQLKDMSEPERVYEVLEKTRAELLVTPPTPSG